MKKSINNYMNQYKKFKEWLITREDNSNVVPSNSEEKKVNDLVATAAAGYAKKIGLIPGGFKINQLQKAMGDPQIKALGPNAGKAIEILKGGDSMNNLKKPGNQ